MVAALVAPGTSGRGYYGCAFLQQTNEKQCQEGAGRTTAMSKKKGKKEGNKNIKFQKNRKEKKKRFFVLPAVERKKKKNEGKGGSEK